MLSEKRTGVWKLFNELSPASLGFCFSNLKSPMQQHYLLYLFIVESHYRRGGTFHPHGIHVTRSGPIDIEAKKQGLFSLGRVSPGLSWHFLSWQGGAVPKTGGRICAWMCSGLVALWALAHILQKINFICWHNP